MRLFFFFQAEDGIRDKLVTGVQTCALPIFPRGRGSNREARREKPGRGRGAARRVPRRSRAIHGAGGGSDEPGSTHEIGQAAGGENAGGGMRAWRKRRGTASGGRGA